MDWRQRYVAGLAERDLRVSRFDESFNAFEAASSRAAYADRAASTAEQDAGDEPTYSELLTALGAKTDLAEGLKKRLADLQAQLGLTQSQLDRAQQRTREMAEEQYMKTHHVQTLHDEILALTLQLNVREQTVSDLEAQKNASGSQATGE